MTTDRQPGCATETGLLELEANVVLRDGSIAHVQPIGAEDEPRLLLFLQTLPDEDRHMRFFSLSTSLAAIAHDEATGDYATSLGLLATVGSEARIVGHALYVTCGASRAEVGFAIAAEYQGHGLATILLGQLAQAAAAHGIQDFVAIVLPENQRMLDLPRQSGFPLHTRYAWNTVEVTLPTSLSAQAIIESTSGSPRPRLANRGPNTHP